MVVPLRILRLTLFLSVLTLACTYQRRLELPVTKLPEQIHAESPIDAFQDSSVGVFRFTEPAYASGTGKTAAESVYFELRRRSVFSRVTDEVRHVNWGSADVMDLARANGYDLVVTGEVLYYFDGTSELPSRVVERMQVVRVPTQEVLWHATTVDEISPAEATDYFVVMGKGAPAPPATLLLQRNAEKFCNLLLDGSRRSTPEEKAAVEPQ